MNAPHPQAISVGAESSRRHSGVPPIRVAMEIVDESCSRGRGGTEKAGVC
jgi:hypothetical protein